MFMGSEVLVHEAVVSFGSWGYYFRVLWFGAVGAFSSGSIGLATLSFILDEQSQPNTRVFHAQAR